MPVARPRVGELDPLDERAGARARGRPEPEGAVDVHPGAGRAGGVARPPRGRRTRRCSRCPACAHTIVGPAARMRARPRGRRYPSRRPASPAPRRARARRARAGEPPGRSSRAARRPATTRTRRRAVEAVAPDVPTVPVQHLPAPGGQPDRVGRLAACDEANRRRGGDAEQLLEPAPRDVLEGHRGRRQRVVEGALVPADREHVGDERGIQRSADHEAEVAWPRRRHQTRLGAETSSSITASAGLGSSGSARASAARPRRDSRSAPPRRRKTFPVIRDQLDGPLQRLPKLVHRGILNPACPSGWLAACRVCRVCPRTCIHRETWEREMQEPPCLTTRAARPWPMHGHQVHRHAAAATRCLTARLPRVARRRDRVLLADPPSPRRAAQPVRRRRSSGGSRATRRWSRPACRRRHWAVGSRPNALEPAVVALLNCDLLGWHRPPAFLRRIQTCVRSAARREDGAAITVTDCSYRVI